jgi:hypothetical protein
MTSKAKLGTGGLYWQEIGDKNYARLTDIIADKNAEIAELKADIDDLKGTIGLKDILIEYFDRKAKLSVREEQ